MVTLTPRSLRRGVRAGAMGARVLGGLNMLGAVGLRNGALGIPFRGAERENRQTGKRVYTHGCVSHTSTRCAFKRGERGTDETQQMLVELKESPLCERAVDNIRQASRRKKENWNMEKERDSMNG